jgi:hypothetical protein
MLCQWKSRHVGNDRKARKSTVRMWYVESLSILPSYTGSDSFHQRHDKYCTFFSCQLNANSACEFIGGTAFRS